MRWIVQNGFKVDKAYQEFLDNLDRMDIDVQHIKTIPFSDETDPPLPDNLTNVICFGSIGLGRIARKKNWTPGIFFNENFDMRQTLAAYVDDVFNSHGSLTSPIGIVSPAMLEHVDDAFFIRPVADDKCFCGQVITKEEFFNWQKAVIKLDTEYTQLGKDNYVTVTAETVIQISPVKEIMAEYRFLVVDKEVVTGSRYKARHRQLIQLPFDKIDDYIIQYARDRAMQYQPDRAFVLDVAIDEDGNPKILELGCINACGFYSADTQKLIDAIENMVW